MAYSVFICSIPELGINVHESGHMWNFSNVSDPYFDEAVEDIRTTLDPDERNRKLKELGVYAMSQAWEIACPGEYTYTFWQPWLKSYSGEYTVGPTDSFSGPFAGPIWVDQELKKAMGH